MEVYDNFSIDRKMFLKGSTGYMYESNTFNEIKLPH